MVNIQDLINQHFPTPESRQAIKSFSIQNSGGYVAFRADNQFINTHFLARNKVKGELDLNDFVNLESLNISISSNDFNSVSAVHLENCTKMRYLYMLNHDHLQPYTFLEAWKQEITQLKAQLAQFESPDNISSSDTGEPLNTIIQRKRAQLVQIRDNTRLPTKHLRKEIELLEKIQALQNQITQLQAQEANYQQQIRQKDQQITQLQTQLNQVNNTSQQSQRKITQLEEQITTLQAEKQSLEQRLITERQQALQGFQQEKNNLTNQITQLSQDKDKFQKSAEYLRETLRNTEAARDEAQEQAKNATEQTQQQATIHQEQLTAKDSELATKQENYKLIQERNTDLQTKLQTAQTEITKLTEWISKLESASAEGDAFQTLQKELATSQQKIQELQEQLTTKQPARNHWWIIAILALIALYFLMK